LIKNTLLVLVSVTFALVACEIFLRIAGFGFGNSPKNADPLYHHAHPKNYKYSIYVPGGEYGGWETYYDNNGFITDSSGVDTLSNDSEEAIIFLGDSFTEAKQVPFDQSFVQLSAAVLDRKVINTAVSSYSTIIYLSQVRNLVKHMRARDIVLQLYSNDYKGDQNYGTRAVYNENGRLAGVDGGTPSMALSLLRSFYLVRLLRRVQLTIQFKNSLGADTLMATDNWEKVFAIEQTQSNENIAFTHSLILEIQTELEEAGKRLHVFMIPSRALSKQGKCCNADTLYETFKTFANDNAISFIDLNRAFENAPNQTDLFFEADIHLTTAGHLLVGKTLVDHFESVNR